MMKLTNAALLAMRAAAMLASTESLPPMGAKPFLDSMTTSEMESSAVSTASGPYPGRVSTSDAILTSSNLVTSLVHKSQPTQAHPPKYVSSSTTPPSPSSAPKVPIAPHKPSWTPYAPHLELGVDSTSLVRHENNLSEEEVKYLRSRKFRADKHLEGWIGSVFGKDMMRKLKASSKTPTLALSTSGGGVRSLLTTAGVLESLSRDRPYDLYNSMTLFSSTSTTAWLPFIMIRDGYTLREFVDLVLKPQVERDLFPTMDSLHESHQKRVKQDLYNRDQLVGSKISMSAADTWSRILAYKLLSGPGGQDNTNYTQLLDTTLSDLMTMKSYKNYHQPMPILNLLSMAMGACMPSEAQMPFEVTPFYSGTWAADDNASPYMVRTRYLDSRIEAGPQPNALPPKKKIDAVVGWDNVGLLAGISSFPMNMVNCHSNHKPLPEAYREWVDKYSGPHMPIHAKLHSPFFNHKVPNLAMSHLTKESDLHLVDGSEANHSMPLLSLLQPGRDVDVIVAVDSSTSSDSYPDGSQMIAAVQVASKLQTYDYRMPAMPQSTQEWREQMPSRSAIVFGCDERMKSTIIYLPNKNMAGFAGEQGDTKWQYNKTEANTLFENGVLIGEQGNAEEWTKCMGCFILKKTDLVSEAQCGNCWKSFCYKPNITTVNRWVQPPNPFEKTSEDPNAGSWNSPAVGGLALVAVVACSLLL